MSLKKSTDILRDIEKVMEHESVREFLLSEKINRIVIDMGGEDERRIYIWIGFDSGNVTIFWMTNEWMKWENCDGCRFLNFRWWSSELKSGFHLAFKITPEDVVEKLDAEGWL